jgi:hypothetical protein
MDLTLSLFSAYREEAFREKSVFPDMGAGMIKISRLWRKE